MSKRQTWISAAEAARSLNISRATLYAYVSRGFIRSQATAGSSRERRYSRDDIERMRLRTEERRDPDKAAARALNWGMPILESSIALIENNRLYYRGRDAVALAQSHSLEEVAALIWTGRSDPIFQVEAPERHAAFDVADETLTFAARAQARLAAAAAHDHHAFDLRPESVARTGWRILRLMTATAAPEAAQVPKIEDALAQRWRVAARGVDVLRAALILCADHELNVSSFTARCVASAGSHPYAVVIAGLAALEGPRHGGASARVEAMLGSLRAEPHLRSALRERLRRGEAIDGFGHPLYRDGDPRAEALMTVLGERYARSPELAYVTAFAQAAAAILKEAPTLDFALAAVSRVLRLPAGAPLTLFAIGRTIGWIGHAIEQYATGQLIRPRAKYVGAMPGDPATREPS